MLNCGECSQCLRRFETNRHCIICEVFFSQFKLNSLVCLHGNDWDRFDDPWRYILRRIREENQFNGPKERRVTRRLQIGFGIAILDSDFRDDPKLSIVQ